MWTKPEHRVYIKVHSLHTEKHGLYKCVTLYSTSWYEKEKHLPPSVTLNLFDVLFVVFQADVKISVGIGSLK